MNGELTGIARDVVADFLICEKPPLTVQHSLGAKKGEKSIYITYSQYHTAAGRLLFFPSPVFSRDFYANPYVYIKFFFRGRGLYVYGALKKVKNGFAFLIPAVIYKVADLPSAFLKNISAQIYMPGFSAVHAECRLLNGYDIFNNRLWLGFSKEEAELSGVFFRSEAGLTSVTLFPACRRMLDKTKRVLYLPEKKIPTRNFFPFPVSVTTDDMNNAQRILIEDELVSSEYDAYIPLALSEKESVHTVLAFKSPMPTASPDDVEDRLFLLPVCRFLGSAKKNAGAVSGRVEPLSILCLTHSLIILGGLIDKEGMFNASFPLERGGEYYICIKVFVGAVCRFLKTNIIVSKIYKNKNGAFCALCVFSQIREEDRRFLYEKFYKTLYK